jgi:hypothetical protein
MHVPWQAEGRHDCSGDAAAFVLGALEPAETQRFLEHLDACVICQDEVDSLRGVVQALPMAAPHHPAPKPLRRPIIRAVRQAPRPVSEGPRQRLRRFPWPSFRVLTGAVAGAVLAGGVAVVVELTAPSTGGRVIQAQVAASTGLASLRIAGGRGELVVHHLPPPPPGHVYEVWLKTPDHPPAPANVLFSVTSRGSACLGLPESLRGVSELLVTPERDGGSAVPTHAPVIVARLT